MNYLHMHISFDAIIFYRRKAYSYVSSLSCAICQHSCSMNSCKVSIIIITHSWTTTQPYYCPHQSNLTEVGEMPVQLSQRFHHRQPARNKKVMKDSKHSMIYAILLKGTKICQTLDYSIGVVHKNSNSNLYSYRQKESQLSTMIHKRITQPIFRIGVTFYADWSNITSCL